MKLSDHYILQTIHGIPYLLPYGQAIAEYRKGVRLNETGVFLWKKLTMGYSQAELLESMAVHYHATKQELPILEQDLKEFLSQLSSAGILQKDIILPKPDYYFRIANITIGYSGNKEFLMPSLLDFSYDALKEDEWKKRKQKQLFILSSTNVLQKKIMGTLLIKTDNLQIIKTKDFFIFFFPIQNYVKYCYLSFDGSLAYFYLHPSADTIPYISSEFQELKQELFYAFRDAFLFFAQKQGLFALHSASLLYRNKAWLFAGASGTGKSTHTNLWKQQYHTPILNGDLNLCQTEKNHLTIYGMPWCGTSGIYTKKEYPIGGIILLQQSKKNKIELLSTDQKQLLISQRLISPFWTEELFLKNLQFAEIAEQKVPIFRLACNMETSAAKTAKTYIDKNFIL